MADEKVSIVVEARDLASRVFDHIKAKALELRAAVGASGASAGGVLASVGAQLRGSLASLRSTAAGVVTGAVTGGAVAIAGLAAASARFVAQATSDYERLTNRLRAFTGGVESARRAFLELARFAGRTPFAVEEVVEAFVRLRTIGIRPTESELSALGDMASAFGKSIADVAEAARGAMTGEFDRLKQFGVVARTENERLAVTFEGVTVRIGRDAQSIVSYLEGISKMRFAGAMERELHTLSGSVANLRQQAYLLAIAMGDAGVADAFATVAGRVRGLTSDVAENRAEVAKWTSGIVATLEATTITAMTPLRLVWNAGSMIVSALNIVFTAFVGGVAGALLAVIKGARMATEAVTGETATTLRRLEQEGEATFRQLAESNRGSWAAIKQDGKDALGALSDAWDSYANVVRNVTGVEQARREAQRAERLRVEQITEANQRQLETYGRVLATARRGSAERAAALTGLVALERALVAEYNNANTSLERREAIMRLIQQAELVKNSAPPGADPKGGGRDVVMDRIQVLTKATQHEETRATALRELEVIERRTTTEIVNGNLTLSERVVRYERLDAIQAAYESTFRTQVETLKIGLATEGDHGQSLETLASLERALTGVVADGTRRIDERIAAYRRLQDVQAALGDRPRPALEGGPLSQHVDRQLGVEKLGKPTRESLGIPSGDELTADIKASWEDVAKSMDALIRPNVWQRLAQQVRGSRSEIEMLNETVDDVAMTLLDGFGNAIFDTFAALASGSQSAGAAFGAAMLGAVSQAAKALGDFFRNRALGELASMFATPPNPMGARNAALFGAAAVGMYALAGAGAGAAQAAGGGGSGGRGSSFSRVDRDLKTAEQMPQTLYLEGDGIDFKDYRQVDRLAKTFGEANGRKTVIRNRRGKRSRGGA